MNNPLEEAQSILSNLKSELSKQRTWCSEVQSLNPDFEELSEEHWLKKQAQCWLHGGTDIREKNELDSWLFDKPPLSDTANEKASKCIKCWKVWLKQNDQYYVDFKEFELEKPKKNEILYHYITRMAALVESEGKGARLQWRALKSFLAYMKNIAPEEIAFIEQIFPKKMDLQFGKIIRKIPAEVYPISQEVAGDILRELARLALKGRANSRQSAIESLGLCWMCLTASRLRLPTYLEMIEKIKVSAINIKGKYPFIHIPTLFGPRKVRISKRVAHFLLAISRLPSKTPRETILLSPKRSLTRTLERAIENCALPKGLGNITYLTLLSSPHHFGKYQRYKLK